MNAVHKPSPRSVEFPPPAGASTAPVSVHVRRRIAAPAQALFDAWLDPAAIAAWMRPFDTVRTEAQADPVVGGSYRIDMVQPDGALVEHVGTYVQIDPPRRLVFTWASPATQHKDSLVTIEFIESDGATEVSLTHEQLPEYMAQAHVGGWTSALEKLAARFGSAA
ncbi:SRPBCC family protein [Dokdonella immobilis]|uniref:Uncharacterized conserved protein YndB, AHSA1/START domain n=1 Tax=Dokdonella immobilis TaxID=578942 RepID=A0A1I5A9K3_9GAMM|nr:SRPBCC domain-containing protein [Dokdonella immobilis]SFN59010.1 Uncharacterized conserved protein YndB, AHSA1/START domain [Dokdonella immobilis]